MVARATIADAGAGAALLGAVAPEWLITEATLAYRMASAPPRAQPLHLKLEREGAVIGWGWAMLEWVSTSPTDAFAGVAVAPAHRREGLGSELWSALETHLDAIGATVVRSPGDDATARGFAEPRGFRQTGTHTILSLGLATVEPPGALPPDVSLAPFAAFADDPERVYAVDFQTTQDEPGDHDFGGMTLEDWVRETYDHPSFDTELSQVLCVEGEPVGTGLVFADRATGRAVHGGTGVLAIHRGRGLGLLLKRVVLARAREAGIERIFTTNDETNGPMLAINRRVGFAPFATRTAWRRG
jgi:GNAT superfamily N-acetyltransferase